MSESENERVQRIAQNMRLGVSHDESDKEFISQYAQSKKRKERWLTILVILGAIVLLAILKLF